jgi:hypothetical protein
MPQLQQQKCIHILYPKDASLQPHIQKPIDMQSVTKKASIRMRCFRISTEKPVLMFHVSSYSLQVLQQCLQMAITALFHVTIDNRPST